MQRRKQMTRFTRLLTMFGFLTACSVVGFLVSNSTVAKPAFAQAAPPPCTCSTLTKLEYTPSGPTDPLVARLYVGQCQCGTMSCVVTTGALQCMK
jgi:hypothetical protein